MINPKIGDRVINSNHNWASSFKKYDGCVDGSICGKLGAYCCDYDDSRDFAGGGFILEVKNFHKLVILLVKWDNGDMCGKSLDSVEIDVSYNRDRIIQELFGETNI